MNPETIQSNLGEVKSSGSVGCSGGETVAESRRTGVAGAAVRQLNLERRIYFDSNILFILKDLILIILICLSPGKNLIIFFDSNIFFVLKDLIVIVWIQLSSKISFGF